MMRTFEDLIADLGGMSKFQVTLVFLVNANQLTTGWSMLMMSFAGLVPDFNCIHESFSQISNNETLNECEVNGTSCSRYDFVGSEVTVITEWDIVCDLKWAKQLITSIQMAGVLVGAVLAGQISDTFGRKISVYGFNLFHIIVNLIAAFSVSWVMFAVMRFFIGIGIGAILVIVFIYSVEFLPIKWRSIQTIFPTWVIGVSLFSVAALLFENWSYLHISCAIISAPSLLGWFFVPESIRWLTLKGKIDEAKKVIDKIAKFNGKEIPADVDKILQHVVDKELKARESAKSYSYLDLFRSKRMILVDAVIWFFWFSLSLCFYGISFGVSSLSGNLYLNIFLLSVLELPPRFVCLYLINKFGRKWTTFLFYFLSFLPMVGCLISELFAPDDLTGSLINGFCLTAKMMIGAAWSCAQMWTSELYPTVVRNLGLGWASFGARIGAAVAPFVINMDEMPDVGWGIMSAVLLLGTLLCLALDETNGKDLPDSLSSYRENDKTKTSSF